MTAGMVEVIAAHRWIVVEGEREDFIVCRCRARITTGDRLNQSDAFELHAAHVAEELTKAGYGSLQDFQPEYGAREMHFGGLSKEPHSHGPVRDPRWMDKSTHVRMIGPWVELVEPRSDAA